MKFYLSPTIIASYFSFFLLCLTLFNDASNEKQTNALMNLSNNVYQLIINKFLTIQDILILRATCNSFENLLTPNDEGMVIFCNYADSKTMVTVDLYWINLGYFLNESYDNALYEIEIFNITENQYAVLTRTHDQKNYFLVQKKCFKQYPRFKR